LDGPLPPQGTAAQADLLLQENAMTTVTLEVRDLVGMMDFAAVEKRLAAFPGVTGVAMNAGSTTATITFDPALINVERLAGEIEACGFHCGGRSMPRHLCAPEVATAPPRPPTGHVGHMAHDHDHHIDQMRPATRAAKSTMPAGMIHEAKANDTKRGGAGASAAVNHDEMAHEMGHGAGMDMQDMAKDSTPVRPAA
jgi:Cu2+-exporting ATPase